jgi:prepilin peptidase CpaA
MQAWPSFAATLPASLPAVGLTLAGVFLLVAAALHDIAARTVPNWIAAALLPAGVILRTLDNTITIGLPCAFLVLLVTYFCWRRGWMGGGDVKLLAAAALVVPPTTELTFLAAVALSGSGLALIYLAAKRIMPPPGPERPSGLLARAARAELWRIRRGGPLPYACAIAAGFIFVIS